MYSCSGGLLADKDESSEIPYFLTANHCLKSNAAARNLELFWNYTKSTESSCDGPDVAVLVTTGGTVKATGAMGDFTLLELKQSPPKGSVFLGWNSAEIATQLGAELHRVHHPRGAPQSYSTHVTDPGFGTCSGLPIPQFIYSRDTLGTTEGGSSGSVVVNSAGEVVGQLYGGCGSNQDVCFHENWRTVDGAFAFYFDRVAPFLAAASCEPVPESCDDDRDNDCDKLVDCDDDNCVSDPACESAPPSCGPKNSACGDGPDCCSGICKRNGRCR